MPSSIKSRPPQIAAQEDCLFRDATVQDSEELVSSYESIFGVGGVRAPGHQPYPAPEVFTTSGIISVIEDPNRDLIVAECEKQIAGAMIVNHTSQYHRDFACVSVRPNFQGKQISTKMLCHVMEREKVCSLSVNTTEIVTHSMLSQAAHHKAGYKHITGFGFCQYPNVFFAEHPESCLWISSIEGRVASWLRGSTTTVGNQSQPLNCPTLSPHEQYLFQLLQKPREVFVPEIYFDISCKILAQFNDALCYRVFTPAARTANATPAESKLVVSGQSMVVEGQVELDLCGDAPYAYLCYPATVINQFERVFEQHSSQIQLAGKAYVQARIPANSPSAWTYAEFLRRQGFVFLGLAPLFQFSGSDLEPNFQDVLIMQWLAPSVVRANQLPGETEAVVKLFGHPLNLTGPLIKLIRQELRTPPGAFSF